MDERDPAAFAASLTRVASEREIASLAPGTNGVVVDRLDDRKLRLLSEHAPQIRHILGDGKCRVTDAGLAVLARFSTLETLDLEFGAITDIGLARLAAVRSLR